MDVVVDLAVIRSQEYYNKITFQADLHIGRSFIIETAGGGRYDHFINRLVGVNNNSKPIMPATGFAFPLKEF